MHRSDEAMICIGTFKKRSYISIAKAKNFVVFLFTHLSESLALFIGDFFMNLNSVESDEAMKRGDEALNASLLLFLRSVKRFIATVFDPALNASSPLLFKRNHRLMLHCHNFF
jgi:hypothetical protein